MKKRRLCPQPIFDEPSLAKAFEKHAVKLVHIKNVWRECFFVLASPPQAAAVHGEQLTLVLI